MSDSISVSAGRPAQYRHSREFYTRKAGRAVLYLLALIGAVFFMGPFLWTVGSSLKTAREIVTFPPTMFPERAQWVNYPVAWNKVPFGLWYRNTLLVVGLALVGEVITSTLVAYGFARFNFPGRNVLFMLVLSMLMIPGEVTMIPTFLIFRELKWLDTLKPLWVPAWFGGGAFYVFLMRQFFMTIPMDFDEAAQMDGAGTFRVLWQVLLPLCQPALTTVAIFSFLAHWNNFFGPLIYLNSPEKFTVSLGLRHFQAIPFEAAEPKEHLLMAATIIMAAPCVLMFFVAQRYFVKGIVMSGIKG
jgi:ABC-type glycerol-3-phosphate transport system permease component